MEKEERPIDEMNIDELAQHVQFMLTVEETDARLDMEINAAIDVAKATWGLHAFLQKLIA